MRLSTRMVWLMMHLYIAMHSLHHHQPEWADDRKAEPRKIKHYRPEKKKYHLHGTK